MARYLKLAPIVVGIVGIGFVSFVAVARPPRCCAGQQNAQPSQRRGVGHDEVVELANHVDQLFWSPLLPGEEGGANYPEELGISAEQHAVLQKLRDVSSAAIRLAILRIEVDTNQPDDRQWNELHTKARAEVQKVLGHAEAIATDAILSETQALRMKQILWQGEAERALLRDEVAHRLGLSDRQRKHLAILNDLLRELYARSVLPRDDLDYAALVKSTKEQMWNVLYADQLKKYQELLGPKFDAARPKK